MINVSNAFKNELYLDRRNYLEYADITLSGDQTLNLTNKDFWQGGMSLDDAVSGNDAFEVGAAIVNSCSLTIENLDDRFSEYDFLNAKVVIYVGLNLPDGTTEKIRKGTYTVNDPKYNGATISLNCQDNMTKFDRPYSESSLGYPATLGVIVRDACSTCGVTLQTPTFPHSDFVIQTRPTDEAITFREVISWAAQIAGCFCRCDVQGRLELKWYNQQLLEKHGYDGGIFDKVSSAKYTTGDNVDGGTFNPWSTGDVVDGGTFEEMEGIHHIYSHYSAPVISTDDVVITGVRVLEKAKEQDEETSSEKDVIITYQSGTDGYVVSIENNELIQGGAGLQISNWLGQQLIGFRFRKASLNHASDPTIEAGDIAIVTDRKQNTYPIIISSTRFSTGSAQSTESSAETPARNSTARFSATTKNYVEYRKDIQKERTEREKAQEELKERIDSSSGLYTTEQTQPDGSTIFYMHDKPTLGESKIVWKMTAEAWGVSTDGGDTYNAGMTVDGDTIVRILTAVGVNADWIKTGALRIEKDGKVIFLADADTKRVEIVADEFSLSSGDTIDSIAEGKANTAVNDFVSKTYDPKIAELQKQLDGQIESFYYDYAPALDNVPASGWTTEADKQKHEGDLFFDKTTGLAYRFFKDTSGWTWQLIKDNDISKAIADAAAAQDTADHKRRVFVSQPTPPYDVGDLWVQGENGDILRCQTARESGAYASGDWVKASKYTDDSALKTFIDDTYTVKINELETQADKKAETWYQSVDPSTSWTSAEKTEHTGDLWYNTSDQKTYIYSGSGWEETKTTPPDAVFDQIDGKAQIFINTPTVPYHVGDLWFNSDTSDIMTCIKERTSGNYTASEWQKRNKYTDNTELTNFITNTYEKEISVLEQQADKKAETWYQGTDPAGSWTTDQKAEHKGDLWYNTSNQKTYIYNGAGWDETKSTPPQEVFDQIDGKAQIFINTPTVPYHRGDLWFQSVTSDIMTCITERLTGNYTASDWQKRNDYIDRALAQTITNNALSEFFDNEFQPMLDALKNQADKKSENWYQEKDPLEEWIYLQDSNGDTLLDSSNGKLEDSSSTSIKNEHANDLWYSTTEQKIYYWDGTKWNLSKTDVPDELFDTIDGKAQVFVSTPVPPYDIGDLWYGGTNSDVKVCTTARASGNYVSTDWTKQDKYIDQTAANKAATDAVNGQTQESIFNKLTENGTKKTFRMEKGEIYLNATYIQSGALKVAKGEKTLFLADIDTGKVEIVADKFSLSSGETIETIAENKANTAAGGALESAKNYADTASKNAVDKQTQEDIFNKLTNNGETQGIYIQDGKVYINADYIQSGTFSAARIKGGTLTLGGSSNTNGSLRILNSSGAEVGSWNNSGLKAIAGTIGPWTIADTAIYNGIEFRGNKNTKSTGVGTYGSNWAFWAGDGRFTVDQDGNMRAENGVFGGSLDAATGTFSGSLSAAGGSFNGDISAASGTFTGKVKSSGSYGDVVIGNGYLNAGGVLQIGIVGDIIPGYLNEPDPLGEPSIARVTHSAPMLRYISGNNSFIVVGNSMYVELKTGYNMTFYTNLEVRGNLEVKGNLSVRGTKPRLVETDDYEDRLLYCYETPSPLFGDIGEAITDENGECYIYLDDIFSETVSAQIEYQVFLQKEGPGDIWIAEKTPQYFVVQGTENLKFAWEIKAKQRDYEYERLEKYQENEAEEIDYEQQYLDEIEMLIKEQEEIYYETA